MKFKLEKNLLNDVVGLNIKANNNVVGIIIDYDYETGVATGKITDRAAWLKVLNDINEPIIFK